MNDVWKLVLALVGAAGCAVFMFVGVLSFAFAASTAVVVGVRHMLVTSEPMALAVAEIEAELGAPVEVGWLVFGHVWINEAALSFPVTTPTASGTASLAATVDEGTWQLEELVIELDDSPAVVVLAGSGVAAIEGWSCPPALAGGHAVGFGPRIDPPNTLAVTCPAQGHHLDRSVSKAVLVQHRCCAGIEPLPVGETCRIAPAGDPWSEPAWEYVFEVEPGMGEIVCDRIVKPDGTDGVVCGPRPQRYPSL